jgi:hypothetical protein
MSRWQKIKIWIGIFIFVATASSWGFLEVPCYLFSLCGVISAALMLLALCLTLGTYGSRNLNTENEDGRQRSN